MAAIELEIGAQNATDIKTSDRGTVLGPPTILHEGNETETIIPVAIMIGYNEIPIVALSQTGSKTAHDLVKLLVLLEEHPPSSLQVLPHLMRILP